MNRNRLIALVGLIGVLLLVVVFSFRFFLTQSGAPSPTGTPIALADVDDDGDGIPNTVDQCPFQYALGNGCPATPVVTVTSSPTRLLLVPSATPRPAETDSPPTNIEPTAGDTSNTGTTPDNPQPTQTPMINIPAGNEDELGAGVERAYAPYTLAQGEVGVVRLELELFPVELTPTFRPPLANTPTLPPDVTLAPTSTPLPQVAIANINMRTVMVAHLRGVDLDKFEILDKEPMNEIRAPEAGSVSWWEWHIRPINGIKAGDYSLYITAGYQTIVTNNDGSTTVVETPRGERLDFKIHVSDSPSLTAKQALPTSAGIAWLPVLAGLALLAVIGGAVAWQRQRQSVGTVASFLPRLLSAQPIIPFSQVICFVSYSRRDEEFVIKFTQRLRAEGVNVWRDREDIPAGASWDDEIDASLQRCTHVLFVASTSSVKSDNVGDELGAALNYHKLVIPILIEDCQLPFRIRRNQWVDFRGDFEAAVAKLVKDLGKGAK